jgi:protein-S-isoprenylcysteine O-methyltransferase Ste14
MSSSSGAAPDHAGVFLPPPFVYVFFFLIGAALQRVLPLPSLPVGLRLACAAVCLLLWAWLTAWSFRRFWALGTSIVPVRPATTLVVEGPYRFSRNPMYLGLLILYVGVACWSNLVWPLVLAPALVWTMQVVVIAREERYLRRKFGEDYGKYLTQVRRWL